MSKPERPTGSTSVESAVAMQVVDPFVLDVVFDDSVRQWVDMAPLLGRGVFAPLLDPAFFARATIDPELGTVVWPNGADVSPEFLYYGPDGPPPRYYKPQQDEVDGVGDDELVAAAREAR